MWAEFNPVPGDLLFLTVLSLHSCIPAKKMLLKQSHVAAFWKNGRYYLCLCCKLHGLPDCHKLVAT